MINCEKCKKLREAIEIATDALCEIQENCDDSISSDGDRCREAMVKIAKILKFIDGGDL